LNSDKGTGTKKARPLNVYHEKHINPAERCELDRPRERWKELRAEKKKKHFGIEPLCNNETTVPVFCG
jgi:hypothetical protein